GPQGLDEQNFRQFCQHCFSTRTHTAGFVDRKADRILEPSAGSVVADTNLEDRRKPAKKSLTQFRIARHIPADKLCDLAASTHAPRFQTLRNHFPQLFGIVYRLNGSAVAHDMTVAMWDHDQVTRRQRILLTTFQTNKGASFRQQVKHDYVLSLRRE